MHRNGKIIVDLEKEAWDIDRGYERKVKEVLDECSSLMDKGHYDIKVHVTSPRLREKFKDSFKAYQIELEVMLEDTPMASTFVGAATGLFVGSAFGPLGALHGALVGAFIGYYNERRYLKRQLNASKYISFSHDKKVDEITEEKKEKTIESKLEEQLDPDLYRLCHKVIGAVELIGAIKLIDNPNAKELTTGLTYRGDERLNDSVHILYPVAYIKDKDMFYVKPEAKLYSAHERTQPSIDSTNLAGEEIRLSKGMFVCCPEEAVRLIEHFIVDAKNKTEKKNKKGEQNGE
jgi:hypothetical protein